jgi:hypothetical protein
LTSSVHQGNTMTTNPVSAVIAVIFRVMPCSAVIREWDMLYLCIVTEDDKARQRRGT